MIAIYRKLYGLLDHRERKRALIVFLLILLVTFFETLGVASIMPFVAILMNPEVISTNPYLSWTYEFLGFESTDSFMLAFGLFFFAFLTFSLALRGLGTWAELRFSHNRIYSWGTRLVGGYLRQPYEWFLNHHSADLATAVLAEVNQVVENCLLPAMRVISNSLVVLFLMALLVATDPVLAVSIATILGGGYAIVFVMIGGRLNRLGLDRRVANHHRYHIVNEAFGGIKDVKIAGIEEVVVARFLAPSKVMAKRLISLGLIREIPSLAMQALLFGGMLLTLLYLIAVHNGIQSAIPVVALYALAGYRLMPAIKTVYRDISQLRFSEPALDNLTQDLSNLSMEPVPLVPLADRMPLQSSLVLRDVSYLYPNSERSALLNLSFQICAFEKIGLVGATGSGKSTMADVILGLLRPSAGNLVVDGQEIDGTNVRRWQRTVGYVPQQIFVSDDTIKANVAFGLPDHLIDMEAVEKAAKAANLHEFVVNELDRGYDTHVGERGIRLSGGQRQRIGIARALYHDPSVLIMDEATSALDNVTEHAVMEAVENLGKSKTIIIVAHRLSTVRKCDRICVLDKGQIVASGSYDTLIAEDARFREMAKFA